MNIENIDKAIAIMTRAGGINMQSWQTPSKTGKVNVATTETCLHTCGNSACFAGWIAVSPEWEEFGGKVIDFGRPAIPNTLNSEEFLPPDQSIAIWLGVSVAVASCLIYGDLQISLLRTKYNFKYFSVFYGKIWSEISDPKDIIVKLEYLKEHGSKGVLTHYLEVISGGAPRNVGVYDFECWQEFEIFEVNKALKSLSN